MIDDADTYIVRDVLTDDIIFITPEDALNGSNGFDMVYENEVKIDCAFPGQLTFDHRFLLIFMMEYR